MNIRNCSSFSKMVWIRFPIHFHVFVMYIYAQYYGFIIILPIMINHPSEIIGGIGIKALGWKTVWVATFQTVFIFLALTYDILEWMNKQDTERAKKIMYWRDVLYNGLVVPFTLFVTSLFWTVYAIDRELVYPEVFDSVVPWWFNHCVHTNIAIVVLIETLLTPRRQPTNKSLELKLTTFTSFGYAAIYYSIYYFTGRWLYNVFGIMTWWQVSLFQCLIWASAYFFYFTHFMVNRLFHGSEDKTAVNKSVTVENNGSTKTVKFGSLQKNTPEESFTSDNWHLKYRSLRDKFENSRL
ncbi:unnamed protein product [Diatraea saccharalis]|uniref:Androgen-dependent TFPI-regulating protein n=1 Tax=Diatraea saccharalis TaxID=40085 RepID=A0A9N9WIH7_9NEOP|nr:unnamed protein product [Diatraea saccharalis]